MIIYECSPIFEDFSTRLNSEERQTQLESAISLLSESIDMDMIISEKFDFVNEGVGDFFKGVLEKIKGALKAIKEFFQGLIQKIKEKFNKGKCEANKKAVDATIDKCEEKIKTVEEKEAINSKVLQIVEKTYKDLAIKKYKERFSSYFDQFSDIAVVWIPTGAVFKAKVEGYKDYFVSEANKYIRDPFRYQIDLDASKNFNKMTGGFFGEFEGLMSGANPSNLNNSEGNYGKYTAKDFANVLYSDGYSRVVSRASDNFPIDFKKVDKKIFDNLLDTLYTSVSDLEKVVGSIDGYIGEIEKKIVAVENLDEDKVLATKEQFQEFAKLLRGAISGLNKDRDFINIVIRFTNDEIAYVNDLVAAYVEAVKFYTDSKEK